MKNKMILFSALLFLTACSSSKNTVSTKDATPIYLPQKESGSDKKTSDQDTKSTSEEKVDIDKNEEKGQEETPKSTSEKTSYNIAVLLPLMTDKVPLNYTPFQIDTNINISPEMQEALDFYMGLKLAVDDFKNTGKKVNVFVLDDANSDYQTKKILSERPFPEIDAIIHGNNQNLSKDLIDFSSKKNIPIFSTNVQKPISSELFHTVMPHPNHQLEQLIVKMYGTYPEAPIYIVPDASEENIHNTTQSFVQFIKTQLNTEAVVVKNTNNTMTENGEVSFLPATSTALVIILSNKEAFVKSTISKLYHTTLPVHILGMPTWKDFKGLENELQPNPNIYIPTYQFVTKSKTEKENFSSRFVEEFQMSDNQQAYLGYDLMTYVMTLTDKDKLFEKPTSTQLGLKPNCYQFEFLPVYNSKSISYFTNSQVGFMQYTKGKFVSFK